MGTLEFIPNGDQDNPIVCTLEEDNGTINYRVNPAHLDLKEYERLQFSYSSNSAILENKDLVDVEFDIHISGTSQSNAMANMRAFNKVLRSGGMMKYQPYNMSGNLDTYYHYLPSPPLRIESQQELMPDEIIKRKIKGKSGTYYTILASCALKTKPLATSNPLQYASNYYLESLQAYTNIQNGTSAYVNLLSSSLKGDYLSPNIFLRATESTSITNLYCCVVPYRIEEPKLIFDTNYAYISETYQVSPQLSTTVSAIGSGGQYWETSGGGTNVVQIDITNSTLNWADLMDSTFSPIVIANVDSGTIFSVKVQMTIASDWADENMVIYETSAQNISNSTEWDIITFPESLKVKIDFPDYIKEEFYSDNSLQIRLRFDRISGSGELQFNMLYMMPTDYFYLINNTTDTNLEYTISVQQLRLSSLSSNVMELNPSTSPEYSRVYTGVDWRVLGNPRDMELLDTSFNYKFIFLWQTNNNEKFNIAKTMDVHLRGLWNTTTPFEVS